MSDSRIKNPKEYKEYYANEKGFVGDNAYDDLYDSILEEYQSPSQFKEMEKAIDDLENDVMEAHADYYHEWYLDHYKMVGLCIDCRNNEPTCGYDMYFCEECWSKDSKGNKL